jgi:hypothetical protein
MPDVSDQFVRTAILAIGYRPHKMLIGDHHRFLPV